MKIKRYEGLSEQALIQQVKDELGPQAIIVSIKSVRARGFLGAFKRPRIEVMAAYDDHGGGRVERAVAEPAAAAENGSGSSETENASALKENQAFAAGLKEAYKDRIIEEQADKIKILEDSVASAQEMLSRLSGKLSVERHKAGKTDKRFKNNVIQAIFETMVEQGVTEEVAMAVLDGLDVGPDPASGINIEDIVKMVYANIMKVIGKSAAEYEEHKARTALEPKEKKGQNPPGKRNGGGGKKKAAPGRNPLHSMARNGKPKGEPFVAVFLGPTGVGKTTTVAKLSADFVLNRQVRLSLISADTYRIAAVEQLRTYADILGVDIGVVYNAEDFAMLLEEMGPEKDVILVDTAGRSHKHLEHMEELTRFLSVAQDCHRYLVLSLTTKYEDMLEIADTYAHLTDYKLIFTKLDETKSVGSVLNLCYATGKSVSYITFGQNVPSDIRTLHPEEIARAILSGIGN